jgi:hypothetical protein
MTQELLAWVIKWEEKTLAPEECLKVIKSGQQFRHYKGGIYTFLYLARHSETEEWLVVYQTSTGSVWVRPYDMFFETIQVDGQLVERFTKI